MVVGIGIDAVDIAEMEHLVAPVEKNDSLEPSAFCRRTFSPAERAQADARHDKASVYAGKFAVKEATFKALAPLTAEGFDFRCVETLEDEHGAPQVSCTGQLAEVLAEAQVDSLLCSITNERGLATAIVLAQRYLQLLCQSTTKPLPKGRVWDFFL